MKNNMKKITFLAFFLISLGSFSQNLINNGDFEAGLSEWLTLEGDNNSKAKFSIDERNSKEGGAFKVFIQSLGTNSWDIQTVTQVKLKKKKEYRLTFYAKARFPQSKFKAVVQNQEYMEKIFELSTDLEKYTWDFKTMEKIEEFKFQFFENGTYFIDEVSIERI